KAGATQIIVWDDQDRSQILDVQVEVDLDGLKAQLAESFPAATLTVRSSGESIVLQGRMASAQQAEQARMIAGAYSDKVLDLMEISGGQQVMLQVRFAEVSRSATTNLGFSGFITDGTFALGSQNGPGGNPIGGLAGGTESTIDSGVTVFGSGTFGSTAFEYFLSALRANNLLRVLAEPNLVAMSGQEANFLAGGEFPVPVPQDGGAEGTTITVEFKKFGIHLKFVPL